MVAKRAMSTSPLITSIRGSRTVVTPARALSRCRLPSVEDLQHPFCCCPSTPGRQPQGDRGHHQQSSPMPGMITSRTSKSQKTIQLGGSKSDSKRWVNTEGDEASFTKSNLGKTAVDPTKPILWEHWLVLVQ